MKHRKGSGPRGNPELARERRMAAYSQPFWDILFAAQQGQNHERTFDTHAECASFMARYYRFRIDAIECRAQGATYLRDMYATGKDADGEAYNSHARFARGPIKIEWKFQGNYVASSREEQHEQWAGGQTPIPVPTPVQEDKAERGIEAYMGWDKKGKSAPTTDIDKCEKNSAGHEWDATDTFCLHCRVPKP